MESCQWLRAGGWFTASVAAFYVLPRACAAGSVSNALGTLTFMCALQRILHRHSGFPLPTLQTRVYALRLRRRYRERPGRPARGAGPWERLPFRRG